MGHKNVDENISLNQFLFMVGHFVPKQVRVYGHTNLFNILPILGREGYTVKYGLRPRAIPRAQALFYHISQLES